MNSALATVPRLSRKQMDKLHEILSDDIAAIAALYGAVSEPAVRIMKAHAPEAVGDMVADVIEQTVFFRTVGVFGALAVRSGEMSVPDAPGVMPVLVCDFAFDGMPGNDVLASE